ncbi:hypothetical protein V5799_025076 [Amblyomma americanum]|uniref:Uncharacterized protein n=1 Tax=Amblyomma americanum TaxID=6943 RepID=A0AAQ4EAR9_AMBAM
MPGADLKHAPSRRRGSGGVSDLELWCKRSSDPAFLCSVITAFTLDILVEVRGSAPHARDPSKKPGLQPA